MGYITYSELSSEIAYRTKRAVDLMAISENYLDLYRSQPNVRRYQYRAKEYYNLAMYEIGVLETFKIQHKNFFSYYPLTTRKKFAKMVSINR